MKAFRGPRVAAALLILALALCFQAWAYFFRLNLSLGPRVILQPWIMGQGHVLYEEIADLHTPVMPLFIQAVSPLVPDELRLAKLVLVSLLSLSTLVTFVAGWRTLGIWSGVCAAGMFVLWSPSFGFGKLWYESFLAPISLVWVLLYEPSARERSVRWWLGVGLLAGGSILIKQHALLPVLTFLGWMALTRRALGRPALAIVKEIAWVALGVVATAAACMAFQWLRAGTLKGFLYWTLFYNLTSDYKSLAAIPPKMVYFYRPAGSVIAIPAAIFCLVDCVRRRDRRGLQLGLGLALMVAAGASAWPRYNIFHLQPCLPLLAWLSVWSLRYGIDSRDVGRPFARGIALGLALFWILSAGQSYRQAFGPAQPREIQEYTPLLPLAEQLRGILGPTDSLVIFPDDEPFSNLYYLLRRPAPRFWIFHYPWYMTDENKAKILATLERDSPDWVLFRPERWGIQVSAPEIVDFLSERYEEVISLEVPEPGMRLLKRRPDGSVGSEIVPGPGVQPVQPPGAADSSLSR